MLGCPFQRLQLRPCPGLAPTLTMVSVLSLLNGFKVFREAYLVAGSYPHDRIYLMQHLFNNWFRNLDLGRLTAGAVLMAAVLLGLIVCMARLGERGREA